MQKACAICAFAIVVVLAVGFVAARPHDRTGTITAMPGGIDGWTMAQGKPAAEPKAPVLSETDKQKVIIAAQAVEIAQLKLQQAALEVQRVRAELGAVVAAVQPAGWVLNDKLELVKAAKAAGEK